MCIYKQRVCTPLWYTVMNHDSCLMMQTFQYVRPPLFFIFPFQFMDDTSISHRSVNLSNCEEFNFTSTIDPFWSIRYSSLIFNSSEVTPNFVPSAPDATILTACHPTVSHATASFPVTSFPHSFHCPRHSSLSLVGNFHLFYDIWLRFFVRFYLPLLGILTLLILILRGLWRRRHGRGGGRGVAVGGGGGGGRGVGIGGGGGRPGAARG